MKIPTIKGIIDRRILVNFTDDPIIVQRILPAPFKPKIYKDKAIVGVCLIRLKYIRPKGLPAFIGISSENGAHRIAVEWPEESKTKEGVFIPRRDTDSFINTALGGKLFPGEHNKAEFEVEENGTQISVLSNQIKISNQTLFKSTTIFLQTMKDPVIQEFITFHTSRARIYTKFNLYFLGMKSSMKSSTPFKFT